LEEERKGAAYSPMYRHAWLFGRLLVYLNRTRS
jgi:hypothetical protein